MRKTVPLWCVSEGTMLFRESETGGRHERVAATAVNRVKSCRCGKMGRSEAGIDVRTSYRALLGAVRRVYSFGRSREMVWFRDSFGRSGEGIDVRISYRALIGTVRRVYSFGRSREMGRWCGFETPPEGVGKWCGLESPLDGVWSGTRLYGALAAVVHLRTFGR